MRIEAIVSGPAVTICIEDNGGGMSPDVQERMFDPFFSTRALVGVGLGLGVVRKLVSLYDGTITADSEVGRGTCFTVTLPPAPPPGSATQGDEDTTE